MSGAAHRFDLSRWSVDVLEVRSGGRDWAMERVADMETLWESMSGIGDDEEEDIPYWAEIWPASIMLGDWLASRAELLRGRACLDIGCGLGLTACIASSLGARVTAMDRAHSPLALAGRSARRNGIPPFSTVRCDWRRPPFRARSFSFAWGADVLYEKAFFEPLERLLRTVLAPGGLAWFGEPVRTVSRPFRGWFQERGWSVKHLDLRTVSFSNLTMRVNFWELARNDQHKE
ncbi:MAG: class I SAM-dependent methyltransferase [Deltaproteobacteria bacterium]|nr:class I SAM-dependent methyltransferase [Deltaproteobacteria bacterium]